MQNHRWLYIIVTIGVGLLSAAIVLRLPAAAKSPFPAVSNPAVTGDRVYRLNGTSKLLPQPLICGAGAPGPWRLRNHLPTPVYGSSVVGDGTYAYVIGGVRMRDSGDITQTLRYNPYANIFTSLAPLPDARMMASAVYAPVNNKIYVFGGEKVGTGQIFSTTFIYDIGSNIWSSGTPMPEARAFMSAGYYNSKIYLAGGYSTTDIHSNHSQTWEYDVAANSWNPRTGMPQPLGGAASAVVNGHMYVIGGRDGTIAARNQTYDYDIAHDTWYTRTNTSYGVNVAGAAVLGGKIWVIGGGAPSLGLADSSSAIKVKAPETFSTTLIFDPGTYSWTAGPNLNVARSYVGAAGVGNFAVAIGGWTGSMTSDAVEVTMNCSSAYFSAATYAAGENAGSIQIPVQLDRASPLTATVRINSTNGTATAGKDYTAISSTLTFSPGITNRTFSLSILDDGLYEDNETVFFILSPGVNSNVATPNPAMLTVDVDNDSPPPLACALGASNPWIIRNLLPIQAYGPGVANDGTYAYVLGGFNKQSGQDITQTVRYDPIINSWTALAPLPDGRTMASVVYAPTNNKLYVFGGENVEMGTIYTTTLIYDIAHNTWSTGAPLPGQRAFMSSGYYNGKVYLVGGYSTGDVHSARSQTWEYNLTANTWMTRTSMTQPLGGAASAVMNGHLYVIGGRDGNTAARNQTYDYDIAHDTWSARLNIPNGVNVPGVAVQRGKIWVFGGGAPFLASGLSSSSVNAYFPQTINTAQIYDPAANSWSAGPGLNYPRSFTGGTGLGNLIMAFGGINLKDFGGYSLKSPVGSVEVLLMCPGDYLPVIFSANP